MRDICFLSTPAATPARLERRVRTNGRTPRSYGFPPRTWQFAQKVGEWHVEQYSTGAARSLSTPPATSLAASVCSSAAALRDSMPASAWPFGSQPEASWEAGTRSKPAEWQTGHAPGAFFLPAASWQRMQPAIFMKSGCGLFGVPFTFVSLGGAAFSLCATRLWHTVHQTPFSSCTLWSMMMPLLGLIFRRAEWHCTHCPSPISSLLSERAEPAFSGSSYLFVTVVYSSPTDFILASRNTTVLASTGSWQAMHETSEWVDFSYDAIVSSWTLWQTSAQNHLVDVAPNAMTTRTASSRTTAPVQMTARGRVTESRKRRNIDPRFISWPPWARSRHRHGRPAPHRDTA